MPLRKRRPTTDAELIRELDDRIRRLETRTAVVVGVPPEAYLLQVDNAGRLVATQTTTGTVTVVALP